MADTSLVFNILAKDKASKTFDKVKAAAAAAFAIGATAAVAFGKAALDAGQDVAAAIGATNQVFGASAGTMLSWSKTTADSLGIARADALAAGKDFGSFFTAIGMGAPAAADLSQQWVAMSANMAAFRDVNPTQALDAMQSALRGELDPLQQFIPSINAAAIEQRALAMTGKSVAGELTQQEKALAINALMLESTANTAGKAELAQNGLGVQSAKLQAKLKDTSAEIGQKLLPAALKLTDWALAAINWMKEHEGAAKAIGIAVGSLAAALGVLTIAVKIHTLAQQISNITLLASPITWIVLAIAALIAIIVLVATKTEFFQKVWGAVWGWVKNVAGNAKDFIVARFNALIGFITGLPGRVRAAASGLWDGIKDAFRSAINWIIARWNNFSISLPGVNVPGLGKIGGFTLNTPNLPMLDTGGTILRTGMAVVHRGERVTPARAAPLPAGGREQVVIRLDGADDEFKRFFRAILRRNPNLLVVG